MKLGMKGSLAMAVMLGLNAGLPQPFMDDVARDPDEPRKKPKEKPLDERQPKVNSLSKEARKIYCKVLKETQCRDTAFKAALEEENDGLAGEDYPANEA